MSSRPQTLERPKERNMQPIVIALLGAGSRSFGPETVRDVLLSETLGPRRVELRLMDIVADNLSDIGRYAKSLVEKLGRNAEVSTTTALETALERAQFVVTAVEVGRNLYWAQDYHIPRKYGFRQVFAENGGPGSLFHGLRAMRAMVPIARAMERICPDAVLLNYTNPMHKVCDAITTLSKTRCFGLCHGVWMGMEQVAYILDKHHVYTKDEMARLEPLAAKVVSDHGANHAELVAVRDLMQQLFADLKPHMFKEVQILFPYVLELDKAQAQNRPAPFAPFGTINNPIRMMMMEHDTAGELLRELRKVSADYKVPADACISYKTFYEALEVFEQDLHQHIHVENNLLFLKAAALEKHF